MTYTAAPENITRGTLFVLPLAPVTVIAWMLLWHIGFVAGAIGLATGFFTYFLYHRGSGGAMGRTGAIRVVIITVVTMAVAIAGGLLFTPMDTMRDALVSIGVGLLTSLGCCFGLAKSEFDRS